MVKNIHNVIWDCLQDEMQMNFRGIGKCSAEFHSNPDTYLFLENLHPTTGGHNILADAASTLLHPGKCGNKRGRPQKAQCWNADMLVH